ncbi:hypothetical protein D3C72_1490870 [compost metagenome]
MIGEWKEKVSALVTLKKRPDLFAEYIKNENLKAQSAKKKYSPIENLKKFWMDLSDKDKSVLGLSDLKEDDFNV